MGYANNQNLSDILTCAIEGGSNYWMGDDECCKPFKLVRDAEYTVLSITVSTSLEEGVWVESTVTATEIRKALNEMKVDPKMPAHLQKLASKMLTDPDLDYDAGDADCALQYTLFKEIVFG